MNFNFNDFVWVQLTDYGLRHYQIREAELLGYSDPKMFELQLKPDAEGWYKFQFWDLMHIFGPLMIVGMHPRFQIFKDMVFKLETPPLLEPKALRVIEAAKWANWLPEEGGYRGGRSIEDVVQELHYSLEDYLGTTLDYPSDNPWFSEEEFEQALKDNHEGQQSK